MKNVNIPNFGDVFQNNLISRLGLRRIKHVSQVFSKNGGCRIHFKWRNWQSISRAQTRSKLKLLLTSIEIEKEYVCGLNTRAYMAILNWVMCKLFGCKLSLVRCPRKQKVTFSFKFLSVPSIQRPAHKRNFLHQLNYCRIHFFLNSSILFKNIVKLATIQTRRDTHRDLHILMILNQASNKNCNPG